MHFRACRPYSTLAFSRRLRYQTRMNKETLEDLAKSLADTVPEALRSVKDDLEKNFKSVLQGGLTRLDLVTREEFEVQEAVLARTREKFVVLEQRLSELESQEASTD